VPWNLASGSADRPPAPLSPQDPEYAEQVAEVYETSLRLTPEQRRIALFWADGAGTETPPGHWNRIAIELVEAGGLSYRKAARTFALLNTAQADAFIAAWDAKFVYWCERPDQAIRRTLDPDWSPLIPTPPFPGYVSGHSTTSGAASTVLGAIFPKRSGDLAAMAEEAAISRLYGGIHFGFDNDAGLVLGRRVGHSALTRYRGR
jgi:membrane-associated phospholipid phosphatase